MSQFVTNQRVGKGHWMKKMNYKWATKGQYGMHHTYLTLFDVWISVANVAGNKRNNFFLAFAGCLFFACFRYFIIFLLYFLYKFLYLIVILTMKKWFSNINFFFRFFFVFFACCELFAFFHRESWQHRCDCVASGEICTTFCIARII